MNKKVIFELKGMYRDDFRISAYEFGQGKKTFVLLGPVVEMKYNLYIQLLY